MVTEPAIDNLTTSEIAAAFGADLILLNLFDTLNPKVSGLEVDKPENTVKKLQKLTGRPIGVNLEPVDEKAEMESTKLQISSGRTATRPYFGYGKVVKKVGGGVRYDWYPKCQLVENTDDISTKEESFNEQNDTVTIRAYSFNEYGDVKNYVDSESKNFPVGLTEEKFFNKPIITKTDLANAVSAVEGA